MHILEKGRSLVPVLTNRVLSSSSTFSKDNTITDLYATDEFRATHAVIVLRTTSYKTSVLFERLGQSCFPLDQ